MEAAFVKAFLSGRTRGNAMQSAIAAGYSSKGANVAAARLFHRATVQKAIAKHMQADDVTVERWLAEVRRIAFSDVRDVVTWDESGVQIKASAELSDDAARMVAEVTEETRTIPGGGRAGPTTERRLKVKLHDKLAALTLLGKALKVAGSTDPTTTGDVYTLTVVHIHESTTALERRMARLAARLGTGGLPGGDDSRGARAAPVRLELLGANGANGAHGPEVADVGRDGLERLGQKSDWRGMGPPPSRGGPEPPRGPGQ